MSNPNTNSILYENKKAKIKITYEWLQVGNKKYYIRSIEYLERNDKDPPSVSFELVFLFFLGGIVLLMAPKAFKWQGDWTILLIIAGIASLLHAFQRFSDPGKGSYKISLSTVGGKVFEHNFDDKNEMDRLQQALEKAIAGARNENREE